jgi:hypothetical protein
VLVMGSGPPTTPPPPLLCSLLRFVLASILLAIIMTDLLTPQLAIKSAQGAGWDQGAGRGTAGQAPGAVVLRLWCCALQGGGRG